MTNQTINPVLTAEQAASLTATVEASSLTPTGKARFGDFIASQAEMTAERRQQRQTEAKKKDKLPDRASLVAKGLVKQMQAEASFFCPMSGLVAPSGGLPSNLGYFMAVYHPIAFNCWAICDQPEYIKQLDNAQLSGLILACLSDLGKINYGRGDAATNAYLVRAKLEVVCNRNRLLDLLEWIQNSLSQTTIYYPPFNTNHSSLTLQSLQEWMDWTYSIEVYAFEGSEASPIKQPKKLAPVSAETQIKRLNSGLASSWATLLVEQDGWLAKGFIAKASKYAKTLATAAPVVERMLAALMALAEEAGSEQAIQEAADFIEEVQETRALASKIQTAQLDDDWGTSPAEDDQTAAAAREAFIAKLRSSKEASLAASQATLAQPITKAPTAKANFLELLAARKAAKAGQNE